MWPAPHRVYDNDVIMKTLIGHLSKKSLRTMMMVEKKGDLFNCCVKEMYRDVRYSDIHGISRDSVSSFST